ncbi:hypothetical protein [Microbacterium telephonicum]|uniref:Uncharacterized protein n=1 Tax=Microbacterium telephonicum TaxID=1714841 RepID=A0A498C5B7_9MICO|nr:hypothetical protein [Microbacterium telephonicum]RLK47651.1 hypothetical protein C7474_2246 [Microbacterium telephonicum]
MVQNTKIPDILASFDEAMAASERLRDTFARMGETNLQEVAERNIASITDARTSFLSVFQPRELRRHVDVHPADEDLEPGVCDE